MDEAMEKANGGPVAVPDSTDEHQHALDVGLIPEDKVSAAKETVVTCPVCFGTSADDHGVNCTACHHAGKLKIVEREGRVPEYRTLDDVVIIGMDAPSSKPRPLPTPAEVKKAEERLLFLLNLVRGVGNGNKLYRVTVLHRSPLDGGEEKSLIYTWAKNEQQAGYFATHDVTQRQWARVDGRPELMRNAPVISHEWISQMMNVPIP